MKQFNLNEYLPKKLFLFIVPVLLLINFGISYLAKYMEIPSVKNTMPFSINIESQYLYGLFGLILVFLLCTKMLNKHPLSSAFIITGALYNLLERSTYGFVFDFIKITWGFINLADLMLWFGLILLNYEVWFNTEDEFEPVSYASVIENNPTNSSTSTPLLPVDNINTIPSTTAVPKLAIAESKKPIIEPKIEPNITIDTNSQNDILSSVKTSKIKTVTDQLNRIRSADSQEIFVPKMDYKPKKNPLPKIKVT